MPLSNSAAVLIIDDNEPNRSLLARTLVIAGWAVREAVNEMQGLELARQGPLVILVGTRVSGTSGSEICKRLKSDPGTRSIPVLQTSVRGGAAESLEEGADAYLAEPIDPKELIVTVRALARLRTAEAKAEINLAKLEAVINSMVEGVITADRNGRFLTMNPAALRIHGFDSFEAMPTSLEEQEKVIERCQLDGTPLPREQWPMIRAARGEVVSNFEMQVRRRDTGRVWIGNYNATLVRTSSGETDLVIITFFDITGRKEAERALTEAQARLKSYADELEQKVEERTASLREAISQMEEFSYTVSHDLRAPLRSIKGYAEILVEDHGSRMKGEGMRYLERIVENGERMERLVNDVLAISRISNTKVKLGPVTTQSILESVVREYVNLQSGKARITIESLPPVTGHESLCIQVFSNLLSNAAKFVKPGVVPQIRVWSERTGDLVRINVQDNGIGISPEYHQKIFGMFERLDTDNRYGGTGIGLAIVRRAVEKMNGRVGVESDGRSGSRFWVELPAWTGGK